MTTTGQEGREESVRILPGWQHFAGGRVRHRVAEVVVNGRLSMLCVRPACKPSARLSPSTSLDTNKGSWRGDWPKCTHCPPEDPS